MPERNRRQTDGEVGPEVISKERAVIENVKQLRSAERLGERVGLVLSGGAAHGAYEVGVLSVLAPALERRGERPGIIVGTSAGGVNAAYLGAKAEQGFVSAVDAGCRMWRELEYGDVFGPLLSLRELRRALGFGLEFLGVAGGSVPSVLDNAPLAETIKARISFDGLAENVQAGVIDTAAVIATSYDTGRSVVFHDGGIGPPRDDLRAIDYAPTRLAAAHVRASSAIEALFPAVEVTEPAGMGGWYGDGGTGLNTPLKPALAFGAERLIVIGLNSLAGSPRAIGRRPPDALDGTAQALQGLFADQLANDVATLARTNQIVAGREPGAPDTQTGADRRVIPYMFVAPRERFAIGRLASDTYRRYYAGIKGLRRARYLALLGRLLDPTRSRAHGELFSYVFFAPEFAAALIKQGRRDAERWLAQEHDDGPWQVGNPPWVASNPAAARPSRRRRAASALAGGR
jgi:NTE family protein